RGFAMLPESIHRGLTILTRAVPGRTPGFGHMAPTYLCRFPGSVLRRPSRLRTYVSSPSFRGAPPISGLPEDRLGGARAGIHTPGWCDQTASVVMDSGPRASRRTGMTA